MSNPPKPEAITALRAHLATIVDLRNSAAVLGWDQETYMPVRGAAARAEQLGTLTRLAHDRFVSPTTATLLDAAEASDQLDPASDDGAIIQMVRRDYARLIRLPAEFVAARARAASLSTLVWRQARPRNDFAAFRPALQEMMDFARREADYLAKPITWATKTTPTMPSWTTTNRASRPERSTAFSPECERSSFPWCVRAPSATIALATLSGLRNTTLFSSASLD